MKNDDAEKNSEIFLVTVSKSGVGSSLNKDAVAYMSESYYITVIGNGAM